MDFVIPEYINMKDDSNYNESWLHEIIKKTPSLLGLGDLVVRDSERSQPGGGRLDLLLFDPESETRYEVELQLGATDASHLVRTVEYWDIERKRYPQWDHIAVIVAEDVTSRFLNVIGLFNQAIPLIAVQIRAVKVNNAVTLVATQILGLRSLGTEEEDEGEKEDRAFWVSKSSDDAVAVCDGIVGMVSGVKSDVEVHYKKTFIGLQCSEGVKIFVKMYPKKGGHVNVHFKIPFNSEINRRVDESSLAKLGFEPGKCKVQIRESDLNASHTLIMDLIREAFG